MDGRLFAVACTTCLVGSMLAQPPASPEVLPPTVLQPVSLRAPGPVSPAEAARQREATIKGLKEDLVTFEPGAVTVRAVDGHWQVRTASILLKDFGADRASSADAARLIQDLRVNQMGTVKGANPPCEYWLTDGKPPRLTNSRAVVVPVFGQSVRAENVGGAWVVTDGTKGLHDFGTDGDAAQRAAAVYWKYGFNQFAVIGSPRPTMYIPLTDPLQSAREKTAPAPMSSPLGVINDITKTSLLLPGNVYAGPRQPFDPNALKVVKRETGEAVLLHGEDVLARFGGSEVDARAAMRALQDGRVTELVRVGSKGFPLFLSNGQAIQGEPLRAMKMSLRADRVKTQKIRDTWWVTEDGRPLFEAGTLDDAELMVKVLRHFDLRKVCTFGQPSTGGLRLLTMGR